MTPSDMNRRSRMITRQHDAAINDVARLANEIQAAGETSRTAALHEAERLQAKHGLGLTLAGHDAPARPRGRPQTTGRYDTRAELEQYVRQFSAARSDALVARLCRVNEGVVRKILARPAP